MASLLQPAGGRRQEIVEIGAGVIAERGYRAATLQEISERTGLLKGSLYHYISSKEDLADDLVDGAIEEMDAQIFNLLTDPALAPGARVREFIRRQVALARSPMSRVGMVARSHRELPDGPGPAGER